MNWVPKQIDLNFIQNESQTMVLQEKQKSLEILIRETFMHNP